MNRISPRIIEDYTKANPKNPAVTIYMPTHSTADDRSLSEDLTRFKNIRREVINELEKSKKTSDYVDKFKDQTKPLLRREYWKDTKNSLLILASPDDFDDFHLPVDSEEYYSINGHFYLTPVRGILDELEPFYLLHISAKNPKLYKVDPYEISQQDIGLPSSVADALNLDEEHLRSLQFSSVDGPKGAQYHGHGAGKDTGEADLLKYFRIINHNINEKLDTTSMLMLSGTEKDLALYKTISSYPNLMQNEIHSNVSDENLKKIHKTALLKFRNEINNDVYGKLLSSFDELKGNAELAMNKIKDIEKAAKEGRVGTLLVSMREFTRDTVRDNVGKIQKLTFKNVKNNVLIDEIARNVVLNGGKLVNIYQSSMPKNSELLAINRY